MEIVHPHPLKSFREAISQTFSLEVSDPFCLGLNYAIPAITSVRYISHMLCVIDKKRKCDDGCLVMCGESRTGKSEILDTIKKYFGGYEWLSTNGNF